MAKHTEHDSVTKMTFARGANPRQINKARKRHAPLKKMSNYRVYPHRLMETISVPNHEQRNMLHYKNLPDTEFLEMAIEMKQQNNEEFFGQYNSSQYVDQMIKSEEELIGNMVYGSVFFANIRDVTTTAAESNQPRMIEDLNAFYMRIQHAVHEYGGVVHKCGDDSITALFGAPMPMKNHAQQAVAVAYKIMDALMVLNRQRIARQEQPLRIGLGVNSGDLIIGNTANSYWQKNMIVGQAVNIAAHFSQLNKTTPIHTVFLGETTAKAIAPQDGWHIERLNDVKMADKTAVPLYALLHT